MSRLPSIYRIFLSDRCDKFLTRVVCSSFYTCKRRYESESSVNDTHKGHRIPPRAKVKVLDTTNSKFESRSAIKIPRFLRKTKDKEQISRYYLTKKLCLEKNFGDAITNVKKWLEDEAVVSTSTVLILNGLLYSLCEHGMTQDIVNLKQIMDVRGIKGERSTYTVLIDSFGKMRNFEMVSKLLDEMSHLNIIPHYRSYIVAAELALDEKLFSKAVAYFVKIESVYKEIHDGFCSSFVLKLLTHKQIDAIMSVFQDFRENKTRIGEQTMLAIEKYFFRLPKVEWKTSRSTISASGVCQCCKRKLEEAEFGKPEENLSAYFQRLIQRELSMHASGQGSYDKDSSRKDKLQELFRFLEDEGPFKVVVDGLNVAMHPSHGLDFDPLFKLVENYTSQGQKVLIIAANELINPKRSKAVSTADHHRAMTHLKNIATLYFVKHNTSGIDDLFLINAALHLCRKDYHISLISNDKFMDHRVNMKPETLSYFQRWLSDHQVMVHWYERTRMKLIPKSRTRHARVVQKTDNSWHFPSIDDKSWMCVERI